MELKDKDIKRKELQKEFEQIAGTQFWQDYVARLKKERNFASGHCETDEPEMVARYQGFVRAIDIVLGLPLKVLEVAPNK